MKLSIALLIFTTLLSCQEKTKTAFDECSYYSLKQPNIVWKMPKVLKEISGIEILNNQKIISHNDEKGKLLKTENYKQDVLQN